MKRCQTCQTTKPVSEFNLMAKSKDGLQARCRECSSVWYQKNRTTHIANTTARKQRHREKMNRWLYEYLLTNPCVDCSESDPVVLEFDHFENKEFNVSWAVSYGLSLERIAEEVKKCEVRCANCHRRKTARDFGWWKYRASLTQ